jgi:integrase
VKGILHHAHGYLPQHPEIAQKFDPSLTAEAWRERCANTRARASALHGNIEVLKKEESQHFGKGREPMEPIQKILDLDRPLVSVLQAVKDMLHDLPPALSSPVVRACHFRDTLLVALLAANPLRLRQFCIMEFDKHLVRQEDGSWWLKFKKGEFKNRRAIKGDYRVRVARDVWPLIERYRTEFRPILAGADVCNYVFRPRPGKARSKDSKKIKAFNSKPMSPAAIHNAVADATYCYIPICPGFGPHGFRHIVATDIIKRDPKIGFFLASRALHDKLETVEEAYEHLKTHEFFEPYNDHFAGRWEEAMRTNTAGGVAA